MLFHLVLAEVPFVTCYLLLLQDWFLSLCKILSFILKNSNNNITIINLLDLFYFFLKKERKKRSILLILAAQVTRVGPV